MNDEKTMGQVIQIDGARIRDHLGEMVRRLFQQNRPEADKNRCDRTRLNA